MAENTILIVMGFFIGAAFMALLQAWFFQKSLDANTEVMDSLILVLDNHSELHKSKSLEDELLKLYPDGIGKVIKQ